MSHKLTIYLKSISDDHPLKYRHEFEAFEKFLQSESVPYQVSYNQPGELYCISLGELPDSATAPMMYVLIKTLLFRMNIQSYYTITSSIDIDAPLFELGAMLLDPKLFAAQLGLPEKMKATETAPEARPVEEDQLITPLLDKGIFHLFNFFSIERLAELRGVNRQWRDAIDFYRFFNRSGSEFYRDYNSLVFPLRQLVRCDLISITAALKSQSLWNQLRRPSFDPGNIGPNIQTLSEHFNKPVIEPAAKHLSNPIAISLLHAGLLSYEMIEQHAAHPSWDILLSPYGYRQASLNRDWLEEQLASNDYPKRDRFLTDMDYFRELLPWLERQVRSFSDHKIKPDHHPAYST